MASERQFMSAIKKFGKGLPRTAGIWSISQTFEPHRNSAINRPITAITSCTESTDCAFTTKPSTIPWRMHGLSQYLRKQEL